MATPFLGEIKMFGGTFAPQGYMFCNGQLLPISQYDAVFALVGTTYGGDGQVTFGVPDLRGRAPVHQGTGPGLSTYQIGQTFGVENVTLNATQMPQHSHVVAASSATGSVGPAGAFWAQATGTQPYSSAANNAAMNTASVASSGGNQPHNNMMPFLAISFIFAVEGIFPSRN
jgi:microcystin-dependent protein